MALRVETQAEPIPGYTLIERIGGGGFGEVWKAVAPGGIFKAIKFVYGNVETTGSDDCQRAKQELKALSRVRTVRHPYILSLERYDIINGQLLIVMELADRNLWDRFRECNSQGLPGIPREELLRYMEETAEALDLMNIEYQLQHVDIKPQNLFLVHNHAKVADFGLVKDLEGRMASVTGGVTPVYAAPETFDGWVSRYCDQYSLAIVYQELLTGQRPFTGAGLRQLILQHLQASPNLSSLPEADRPAIARALSKNPDDRFPTCLELVRALRAATGTAAANRTHTIPKSQPGTSSARELLECQTTPHKGDQAKESSEPDAQSADLYTVPPSSAHSQLYTRWINVHEKEEPQAEEPPRAREAPEELRGEGLLFPALILGLGQLGLGVLQRLRRKIHAECGSLEQVPNMKLLYVDTDLESLRQAAKGDAAAALTPHEVLAAKLNRPSHYLRSQDERKRIEPWFDLKMLYRIPRTLATAGLRPLGRLAFFDNYRLISRRLRNELEVCTFPDNLETAIQNTGLGLRSNRPRVYVITGLAGGTGGGIFLDLAYLLRKLLGDLGYQRPEVVGVFLLPRVDRQPTSSLAIGNAFAALTELNHFSSPKNIFTARFAENEAPVRDEDAPYSRCFMLSLPEVSDEQATCHRLSLTADFLFRELATPMGRAADESRSETQVFSMPSRTLLCQTFGLRRMAWPRRALIGNAARSLCREVVERWMSKEADGVRASVQTSVAGLWQREELSGEQLMARLQAACTTALGQTPEAAFEQVIGPLATLNPQNLDECVSRISEALTQIEQIVGKPNETMGEHPGSLSEPLQAEADATTSAWGDLLSGFALELIEQPEYRLAGAEEAVRQMISTIEGILQHYESLNKELLTRASEASSQVNNLLATVRATPAGNRKLTAFLSNLIELIRVYPKWRVQSLLLQRLTSILVSSRGRLSDHLRELNFCRSRMRELQDSFQDGEADGLLEEELAAQRTLFPANARSLQEATEALLGTITPEEIQRLDHRIQEVLREQFSTLADVCLSSSNLLPNLRAAMRGVAETYVASQLEGTSLAEMFFQQLEAGRQAADELMSVFNEASPDVTSDRAGSREVYILAVPPGAQSQRFVETVKQTFPDLKWAVTTSKDDIVFYHELQEVRLSDLEQVGPAAFEAYRQIATAEHFTPHSRTDVIQWLAPSA
jgi:eukaryotic-like serine/threonine-protein kinase